MLLPPWVQGYIRRLPRNYTGLLVAYCENGEVKRMIRSDELTEQDFRERYQRYNSLAAVQELTILSDQVKEESNATGS